MTAAKAAPELMPKTAIGHGNGQFKVIGGGGKRQGGGLFIGGLDLHGHIKGDKEHDDKINGQRDGDTDHIQRQLNDVFPFEGKHDDDGKEQSDEGDGADFGDEFFMIPGFVLDLDQGEAGDDPGDERESPDK